MDLLGHYAWPACAVTIRPTLHHGGLSMPTGKKTKKHKVSLKSGKKLEATKPLALFNHVQNGTHIQKATVIA
jgi:hypothetical protein